MILSVDFSRNYENKQHHEIQSAYFGHEAFTLFTAACYVKRSNDHSLNSNIDQDIGLEVFPVAIVSNQTLHERNIAFSCNNMLLEFVKSFLPGVKKVHFWSDGCCNQFRSQYVFRLFCLYPTDLEINWNYGEAHHFKGPHDGIGGSVKRKVYSDVSTHKVVIQDANHFSSYASKTCNVNIMYLDKAEILNHNVDDSLYIPGTLKVHQVKRINENTVEFYYNSQYKKPSEILKKHYI